MNDIINGYNYDTKNAKKLAEISYASTFHSYSTLYKCENGKCFVHHQHHEYSPQKDNHELTQEIRLCTKQEAMEFLDAAEDREVDTQCGVLIKSAREELGIHYIGTTEVDSLVFDQRCIDTTDSSIAYFEEKTGITAKVIINVWRLELNYDLHRDVLEPKYELEYSAEDAKKVYISEALDIEGEVLEQLWKAEQEYYSICKKNTEKKETGVGNVLSGKLPF